SVGDAPPTEGQDDGGESKKDDGRVGDATLLTLTTIIPTLRRGRISLTRRHDIHLFILMLILWHGHLRHLRFFTAPFNPIKQFIVRSITYIFGIRTQQVLK
nr:hypothetical protein [Tanacetum cinerariifolium]